MADTDVATATFSWLEQQVMEDKRDYLARGRQFERASIEALQAEWIAHVRAWAIDVAGKTRTYHDLASEFSLRGIEPPYALVKEEFEIIFAEAGRLGAIAPQEDKDALNAEVWAASRAERAAPN